ncbi:MAG: phosphotyrosine protein phosphatase [Clostridiales bacterium]|nr:phosphotyrosine protein phosphatase [Clostridiales bacterium]
MEYNKIIFVSQTGTGREAMAAGIFGDFTLSHPVEILCRGLVVLFPEPINQKAEAVLISNGIEMEGFTSVQLSEDDLTDGTLVLTMEAQQCEKILETYENASQVHVAVLTEFVGDELEIINPYGSTLQAYGLCYETLRKSLRKLAHILNGEDADAD